MEDSVEIVPTDLLVDINLFSDGGSLSGPQLIVEDHRISYTTDTKNVDKVPGLNLGLVVAPNVAHCRTTANRVGDTAFNGEEIPDNLENCLAINRAYQHSIQENVSLLTARLNLVRAEIAERKVGSISERLGTACRRTPGERHGATDSIPDIPDEKTVYDRSAGGAWVSWSVFLTRYFCGTSSSSAPRRRHEAALKLRRCEYADMRWTRPWCQSECDRLQRAVIAAARDNRRRRLRAQIDAIVEKRQKRKCEEEEKKQKCEEQQKKRKCEDEKRKCEDHQKKRKCDDQERKCEEQQKKRKCEEDEKRKCEDQQKRKSDDQQDDISTEIGQQELDELELARLEQLEKQLLGVEQLDELELAGHRLHGEHDWLSVSAAMSSPYLSASASAVGEMAREPDECQRQWRHLVHPSIKQGAWSAEEDEVIRRVTTAGGMQTASRAQNVWHCIGQQLGWSRTPLQLFQRWVLAVQEGEWPPGAIDDHQTSKARLQMWSSEETRLLLETVRRLRVATSVTWTEVAFYLDGRTPEQCRSRYFALNPCVKRGHFTRIEDMALMAGVEVFALGDHYTSMACVINGRTSYQLRRRYDTHLAPNLNLCRWSRAEEELLVRLVWQLGGAWRRIAQKLNTGRSPLDCRLQFLRIFRQFRRSGGAALDDVLAQSSGGGAKRCGRGGVRGGSRRGPLVAGFGRQAVCVGIEQLRADTLAGARSLLPQVSGDGEDLISLDKRLTLFKQYCRDIGLLSTSLNTSETYSNLASGSSSAVVVKSKTVRTTVCRGQRVQVLPPTGMYLGRLMMARAPFSPGRYLTIVDNKLAAHTRAICAAFGLFPYSGRGSSTVIDRVLASDSGYGILSETDRDIMKIASLITNGSDGGGVNGSNSESSRLAWSQYPLLPPNRTSLIILRALIHLRWQLEAVLLQDGCDKLDVTAENTVRRAGLAEELNRELAGEARAAVAAICEGGKGLCSRSDRGCDAETVARHRANMSQVDIYYRCSSESPTISADCRSLERPSPDHVMVDGDSGSGTTVRKMSLLLARSETQCPRELCSVLKRRIPGLVKFAVSKPSPSSSSSSCSQTIPAPAAPSTSSCGVGSLAKEEGVHPMDEAWKRLLGRFVSLLLWPCLMAFRQQSPINVDIDDPTTTDDHSSSSGVLGEDNQSLYGVLMQRQRLTTIGIGGKRKIRTKGPSFASVLGKKRARTK